MAIYRKKKTKRLRLTPFATMLLAWMALLCALVVLGVVVWNAWHQLKQKEATSQVAGLPQETVAAEGAPLPDEAEPEQALAETDPPQEAAYNVLAEDIVFPVQHDEGEVQVYATVTRPDGAEGAPLVLLCHGFTGDRGGDGHFAPLANRLAESGIACIAVDFAGNGESAEPFINYTLRGMQQDLDAAVDYMATEYGIDRTRLGVVGHSMGGRIASNWLHDEVKAAALWSPANGQGLDGLEFLSKDPAEREALKTDADRDGSVSLPNWQDDAGAPLVISNTFVDEMADNDPLANLQNYRGHLLVSFAGGDVELLSEDTIQKTLRAAKSADEDFTNLYGLFEDSNHNYDSALNGDAEASTRIAAELETDTLRFLQKNL